MAVSKAALLSLSLLAGIHSVSAMFPGYKHVNCGGGNTEENAPKVPHAGPTAAHLNQISLGRGTTPKPTQGPSLEFLKRRRRLSKKEEHQLVKRDDDFTSGELLAFSVDDNTCGYISGSLGSLRSMYQQTLT
jgi:hypothetical protein